MTTFEDNSLSVGKTLEIKKIIATAVIATMPALGVNAQVTAPPLAPLVIQSADMPQEVIHLQQKTTDKAIIIYHELRKKLDLSHTIIASWLGLKRRSLYNWLNDPTSSTKSEMTEKRLSNLSKLVQQMEPEHIALTYKIAFSPIYGNTKFGESILNGDSNEILLEWYDQLFDKFEAYRKTTSSS